MVLGGRFKGERNTALQLSINPCALLCETLSLGGFMADSMIFLKRKGSL
jgi:hypothetical protein